MRAYCTIEEPKLTASLIGGAAKRDLQPSVLAFVCSPGDALRVTYHHTDEFKEAHGEYPWQDSKGTDILAMGKDFSSRIVWVKGMPCLLLPQMLLNVFEATMEINSVVQDCTCKPDVCSKSSWSAQIQGSWQAYRVKVKAFKPKLI